MMRVCLDINAGSDVSKTGALTALNVKESDCQSVVATVLNCVVQHTQTHTVAQNNQTNTQARNPPHDLGFDLPKLAKQKPLVVSLYLVGTEEGGQLNQDYRNKDYATNVLSFPSQIANQMPAALLAELQECPLGELVVCLPVVEREAAEQSKAVNAHFTHLLVHGCLHLLGYDHELDQVSQADAYAMEALEITILSELGIANPY